MLLPVLNRGAGEGGVGGQSDDLQDWNVGSVQVVSLPFYTTLLYCVFSLRAFICN